VILEIAIPEQTAFFTQRVELDGVDYLLEFSYNQRADCFFVTIKDERGEYILGPLKVVSNWPLLRWHRYEQRLPPGELWAIALNGKPDVPGYGVLGKDVGFYYYDLLETQTP
jgi:hypothetical protein